MEVLKRLSNDLIQARVSDDVSTVFYPANRQPHFQKRMDKYRPGVVAEPIDYWNFIDETDDRFLWESSESGETMTVTKDEYLRYSIEDFCFTEDRITDELITNVTDLGVAGEILRTANWIHAQDPTNPHQYSLVKDWDRGVFHHMVMLINANGKKEMYAGRPYRVFRSGKFRYWTMEGALTITILINRAPILRSFRKG